MLRASFSVGTISETAQKSALEPAGMGASTIVSPLFVRGAYIRHEMNHLENVRRVGALTAQVPENSGQFGSSPPDGWSASRAKLHSNSRVSVLTLLEATNAIPA